MHKHTFSHFQEARQPGSTLRGFRKSPQYVPLFTSGNLCGREWDLLLCKELIQPLQDDSHSRHTLDSLHANTYPEPSAGSGPWSCGCSRRSPSASLWVVRIASAHLQSKHSTSFRGHPSSWGRLQALGAHLGANTAAAAITRSSRCVGLTVKGILSPFTVAG